MKRTGILRGSDEIRLNNGDSIKISTTSDGCNVNEIVAAIGDCDLGIIPNHRNIFTEINTPTRIFEYLALAKPVIAPKTQGIQDYFGDDRSDLF